MNAISLDPGILSSLVVSEGFFVSGSYRYLRRHYPDQIAAFARRELASLVSRSFATFGSEAAEGLQAIVAAERLPWEEKLFHRPMAKLTLVGHCRDGAVWHTLVDAAVRETIERKVEFLSAKVHCSAIEQSHALEHHGFLLMDTMLDFLLERQAGAPTESPVHQGVALRRATARDLDSCVAMIRAGFATHFGRFQADDLIAEDLAEGVYVQWVVSSFEGYADSIFVAESDDRVVGCSIWKNQSAMEAECGLPLAHYSLGAVHPAFAGRGVFSALTRMGSADFAEGVRFVEGPTHIHNLPVQKAYVRLGWQMVDSRHSFHRWLV
jgi:GNAT superfamily N-acetyltransferase